VIIKDKEDRKYTIDLIEEAFYWYECDKNGVLLEE
jgi:hypothetical protein